MSLLLTFCCTWLAAACAGSIVKSKHGAPLHDLRRRRLDASESRRERHASGRDRHVGRGEWRHWRRRRHCALGPQHLLQHSQRRELEPRRVRARATLHEPALRRRVQGKFFCVYRGLGNKIWWTSVDTTALVQAPAEEEETAEDTADTPPIPIPIAFLGPQEEPNLWSQAINAGQPSGRTADASAVVAFNDRLICILRGENNRIYWSESSDGSTWSGYNIFPNALTSGPPSLAMLNGQNYNILLKVSYHVVVVKSYHIVISFLLYFGLLWFIFLYSM